MFELGPEKLLMLLLICLVIFGGKRIPEIGGAIGKGIREFKRGVSDIGESVNQPMEPIRHDVTVPESRDEGGPGPRPDYGPNWYAAYLRDPTGNKLAIVVFPAPVGPTNAAN